MKYCFLTLRGNILQVFPVILLTLPNFKHLDDQFSHIVVGDILTIR